MTKPDGSGTENERKKKEDKKKKEPQAWLSVNAIVPPQNLNEGLNELFALCRVLLGLLCLAVVFIWQLDLVIHIHLVAAVLGPVAIVAVALSLPGRRNNMSVLAGIAIWYPDAISIFGRGLRHFGSVPLSVVEVLAAPRRDTRL